MEEGRLSVLRRVDTRSEGVLRPPIFERLGLKPFISHFTNEPHRCILLSGLYWDIFSTPDPVRSETHDTLHSSYLNCTCRLRLPTTIHHLRKHKILFLRLASHFWPNLSVLLSVVCRHGVPNTQSLQQFSNLKPKPIILFRLVNSFTYGKYTTRYSFLYIPVENEEDYIRINSF